jgi:hypothetical protein
MYLYNNVLEKRRKLASTTIGPASGPQISKKYGNIGQVFKEEKEFTVSLLCAISDLTPTDCLKMMEVSDGSGEWANAKLICIGTQLDLTTKISELHMVKDIMWRLVHNLHARYCYHLAECKKRGIIGEGYQLNLLVISPYKFTCNDQFFTGISYNITPANAPGLNFADLKLTLDYKFKNVWNDLQISFVKPGLAPTKLESFFMKTTGPKNLGAPTSPKILDEITAVCMQESITEADQHNKPPTASAAASSGSNGKDDNLAKNIAGIVSASKAIF